GPELACEVAPDPATEVAEIDRLHSAPQVTLDDRHGTGDGDPQVGAVLALTLHLHRRDQLLHEPRPAVAVPNAPGRAGVALLKRQQLLCDGRDLRHGSPPSRSPVPRLLGLSRWSKFPGI